MRDKGQVLVTLVHVCSTWSLTQPLCSCSVRLAKWHLDLSAGQAALGLNRRFRLVRADAVTGIHTCTAGTWPICGCSFRSKCAPNELRDGVGWRAFVK